MAKNEQTGKKAATVFDVEAHEENQRKFLGALRQIAEERGPVDRLTFQYVEVAAIAERAGLSNADATRIGLELLNEDSLRAVMGGKFCLTHEGCRIAEDYLYEKSSLSKQRKFVGAIKEASAAGAMSLLKEAGKWLGGIVIGAAGMKYGPAITQWVKEWLGL